MVLMLDILRKKKTEGYQNAVDFITFEKMISKQNNLFLIELPIYAIQQTT